jgi:hypothetical protein
VAWIQSNGGAQDPIASLQPAFLDVRGRGMRQIMFKKPPPGNFNVTQLLRPIFEKVTHDNVVSHA